MRDHWSIRVTVDAVNEPLSLVDAKAHLRVTHSLEDDLITGLIRVARDIVEEHTHRALPVQTFEMAVDRFPYGADHFRLPRSPVSSITSLKYLDTDNVLQTLDPSKYVLDDISQPARVCRAYDETWPEALYQKNSVKIVYVAGEASPPAPLVSAMKLILGSLYNHREADCPIQTYNTSLGEQRLMSYYKLYFQGVFV